MAVVSPNASSAVTGNEHTDKGIVQPTDREALWFYVIACGFSWLMWTPVMLEGLGLTDWLQDYEPQWFYKLAYARSMTDIDVLALLGVCGPIVAAIWVTWRFRGGAAVGALFARALPPRIGWHWYLIAFSLPLVYHSLAGLVEMAQGHPFPLGARSGDGAMRMTIPAFLYSVATMTVFIVVEELGWRGVMQPALQRRMSAFKAAVIVGLAWGYWHLPYYINLHYIGTGSLGTAALLTTIAPLFSIPVAILLAWVLNSTSGSIFLCMLVHAVNNSASRLFTHSGDGLWFIAGSWVLAIVVLVAYGAKDLSRKPRFILQ